MWLGNDNYHPMNESYGGNIPARIWSRFMKGALQNVAKHDFIFPGDEVKKIASCGGGYGPFEYYLSGTEPLTPCGRPQAPQPNAFGGPVGLSNENASMPPAPTFSPEPSAPPPPADATQPPDSVGDGTNYVPLDSPAPAGTAQPRR